MSFGQWYVSRGRIPRRTYLLYYVLPLAVLGVLALLADLALGNVDATASATSNSASAGLQVGWVSGVVTLATLVPGISSQVTRLHDRGHSAWWLLFGLIPLIGGLLLLVQTWFLPGEPVPNRYGPPTGGQQYPGQQPPGQQYPGQGYPPAYS